MTDATPSAIGKYRIIELVGEGAMGVVYRAVDTVLDRTVAIKVMSPSIARQEDLRKRFLHEAQAAGSLQHPNVVCVYDLGESDGHLFIAMEFVHGVDLERLIELGEPLSLQVRLDIIIDVLTGLSYAHKRGIVHRDIKPANIRVADDGRAKIMDFGVAHLASSSMTRTGSILGTPSYMSPEQITEGKTTPATDIFAVGAVLYQLLAQMKPFDAPTLQNLLFKIVTEKPKPVTDLMPGLPTALDRIVQRAMAKEPEQRYANALEMANELSAVRAKLSGPSYPSSISLSATVEHAIEVSKQTSETKRRNLTYAIGGAIAAALVVAVAWSQLAKSGTPSAEGAANSSLVSGNGAAPPASTALISQQSAAPPPADSSTAPATRTVHKEPAPVVTPPRREKTTPPTRDNRVATAPKATPKSDASATKSTSVPIVVAPPLTQTVTQRPPISTSQVVTSPALVQPKSDPVAAPPPAATPSPPPTPTNADLAPAIESYARAIESRDIGAVRRLNSALTSEQQQNFEDFFRAARDIAVTFRVASLDASGGTANARLTGSFDYVHRETGKAGSVAVAYAATLRYDGHAWRLVSVR